MADEPSLGELGRLIQLLRVDIRDDMAQINARLDRMVSADVYAVEKANLAKDIADLAAVVDRLVAKQQQDLEAIQRQRAEDANRVTQTRRWVVASVIIPLVGFVLPLVMVMKGAGA